MIKLILFLTLIKGIVWVLFIPLWHFPDEQAHFGHVAYLTEGGSLPMGRDNDLTEEIAISEQLLGTFRDEKGNNRFTYHPEYRIEYTDNLTGKYEEQIKSLPLSARKIFVARESAYYPHFFYRVSGLIYKLFYSADLFVRVFTLRLFWLSIYLLTVLLGWQIAQLIFPKQKLLVLTSTIFVAFQPMLSFVSAGISSDNWHNFLFTGVIYFSLKLVKQFAVKDLLSLMVVLALGFINKPQFLIAFIVVLPVLWRRTCLKYWPTLIFMIGIIVLLGFDHVQGLIDGLKLGEIPYLVSRPVSQQVLPAYNLWQHFLFTANHTIREVLPWYWGVFNWLGVVLPRWVNRVLMRLLLVVVIGLVIKLIQIIKQKRFDFEAKGLIFLTWAAAAYFAVLFFWDYSHVKNVGFSFGIQGRYYFPTIVPHLILLAVGLKQITSYLLLVTGYFFILLNWIGLWTVANSYYDTTNLKTFIIQASQYKPWFAKGWWLAAVLLLYFFASLIFSFKLFKIFRHEK